MATTTEIYGQLNGGGIVVSDVQYTDSIDAAPTGSITCSFAGTLAEAMDAAPKIGSSTEFFPETKYSSLGATYTVRLVLTKRNFSRKDAQTWQISLTYAYYEDEETAGTSSNSTSYSVQATQAMTSIIAHPNYADVPEKERQLALALISGTKPYETVYLNKKGSTPEIRTSVADKEEREKNWEEITLESAIKKYVTSEAGQQLVEKILAGVTTYQAFGVSFNETTYSSAMNSTVKGLGKISSPPNAAPSGGSWLLTGLNASKERGERRWKITKTWTAADNGDSWDEDLYK